MQLLNRIRLWWHRDILNQLDLVMTGQKVLLESQNIAVQENRKAMQELWLKLAQWWQQEYVNAKPPSEWPVVAEVGVIHCPICQASYDVRKLIAPDASQATIVCANKGCGEQMELYRDDYYGWMKPRVEYRERSFK